MRQLLGVSVADYFLPRAADEADLSAWRPILPTVSRVLRTNLFGDAFLVAEDGTVHMLERAGCTSECIAASEEEFWREVQGDPHGWQLRGLADECRNVGKVLGDGQCYAFTTPPVLGGDYIAANVWIAPWPDWFSFTADLYQQIRELPEGATVTFKIVD